MNKSGLIDAVSTTTATTKRETAHAVDAVVHAVTDERRVPHRRVLSRRLRHFQSHAAWCS